MVDTHAALLAHSFLSASTHPPLSLQAVRDWLPSTTTTSTAHFARVEVVVRLTAISVIGGLVLFARKNTLGPIVLDEVEPSGAVGVCAITIGSAMWLTMH